MGLSGFLEIDVDQLWTKRDRLAVDGEDDVAGLDAGAIARLAGVHDRRMWVHVREARRSRRSRTGCRRRAVGVTWRVDLDAVAHERDRNLAIRTRADRDAEISPRVDAGAGDRRDAIAGRDVGSLGRRPGRHDADDDRLILVHRDLGAVVENDRQDDDRQQQVHHRPGDEHLEPLPLRLRQELVGTVPVRSSSEVSPAILT